MSTVNHWDVLFLMVVTIFGLGVFTFIMGIIVLSTRAMGKDVCSLAAQTTRLAQKGIAEEVSGLVGNASALMSALQQMVRTTTGIGLFLILLGISLMTTAYWLFFQYFEIS